MSAMATELKPIEHPTRGELRAYLEHVEANRLHRAAGASLRDRETIVKVHTWLWRVASGAAAPRRAA